MADPRIWKFTLPQIRGQFQIQMPAPAQILNVGLQDEHIVIWASCSPDAPPVSRLIELCFTSDRTPLDATLIGTITTASGIVIHAFHCH